MIKNILTGLGTVSVSVIIGLLTWIGTNTNQVPELKNQIIDLKEQNGRQDELLQQEITHRYELEKQLLILQTRLEK